MRRHAVGQNIAIPSIHPLAVSPLIFENSIHPLLVWPFICEIWSLHRSLTFDFLWKSTQNIQPCFTEGGFSVWWSPVWKLPAPSWKLSKQPLPEINGLSPPDKQGWLNPEFDVSTESSVQFKRNHCENAFNTNNHLTTHTKTFAGSSKQMVCHHLDKQLWLNLKSGVSTLNTYKHSSV